MIRSLPLTLACLGLLFVASHAHGGIIDTYVNVQDGDPDAVSSTSGTVSQNFTITPTVTDPVGSHRILEVTQFSAGQTASLTISGGGATIASTATSTGKWRIYYGVLTAGGLHYDATDGGTKNAFRLDASAASAGLQVAIGAHWYSSAGTSNSGTFQTLTAGINLFPFSSFTGVSPNFADINQLTITIQDGGTSHGGNGSLTRFSTVPEPSSCVLAGMALAILAGARYFRRRR